MRPLINGTTILAGDIGGTKTNLAIMRVVVEKGVADLRVEKNERFSTGGAPSLNAIIREFLGGKPGRFACAGFGVPGPVKDGRVKGTNLAWGVDAAEVAEEFSIPHVEVINDLAANAYGISELKPSDFEVIQEGSPAPVGNRCVVSPGTGLGEAGLFWDGQRYRVWACEGGHTDFAPRTEVEIALLQYLLKSHGHVSVERVASGMGMPNIYNFLRDTGRGKELPEVKELMQTGDAGRIISEFARNGKCRMCADTLEMFVGILAAEAGNMALKSMATGGVFLGGGIPAKILPELKSVTFIHSFNSKGRLQNLMESIPVRVILNDQAALFGAARYAADALV